MDERYRRILHKASNLARALQAIAGRALRRHQTRRLMRELQLHHLEELGLLGREQAEAAKWFWEK